MVRSRKAAGYTILIAGISRDAREMYQEFFVWAGWRVVLAEESAGAFDLAAMEQPDIVATSDRLCPQTGLELCEQLHADTRTAHIPVMILTTATDALDRQRARAAGCALLLIQPTLPSALLAEARRVIGRARRARRRAEGATVDRRDRRKGPVSAGG
jgi:DNA-binding response OmpR family regulator